VKVYKKIGLNSISHLEKRIYINLINEYNLKSREWEITPDPFHDVDNKLLFRTLTNPLDNKKYVNVQIHPGKYDGKEYRGLALKYDLIIRKKYLYKMSKS
jgi:hypothetical protein